MSLTYEEDAIEFSPHDICTSAWLPLNCDTGTVKRAGADPELVTAKPIFVQQCGLVDVTLTREINEAVEDIDPSGQANVNAAYRRIKPTTKGYAGLANASSKLNPLIWSLLDKGAPIIDANHANIYIGVEEAVTAAESCPSCGRASATCKHSVALMTVHNAWCGDERHPQYPFVVMLHKSLLTEPIADSFTQGRGFSTQQYAWTLQRNAGFQDPFNIDPRGAAAKNDARWAMVPIHNDVVDAVGDEGDWLREILDGCACGVCVSPLS